MNRSASLFLSTVLLAAALPAAAQPATSLPDWDRLDASQRDVLTAPVRERWNANPEHRSRMMEHAQRWKAMTPEQRAKALQGVERFQKMSPEERAKARAAFSPFRRMSEAERRSLREKLKAMTPEERKAWLRAHSQPNAGHSGSRLQGERARADEAARQH
ncbi:MAG: DUF3106 domain-containing protein [Lysobacter sp.]|nr:MAG: DUF3106 domain-containing protein [Lysobacter sp.]